MLAYAACVLVAALVAMIAVRLVGPLAALEVEMSDRVRIAMTPAPQAQDARVSIVAIDEASMAKLPYRSPVDRGFLAEVVDALDTAGAAAIGLDILLDQPTEPEKDAQLAQAIRAFDGPVVLAWADARSGMTQAQSEWLAGFIRRSGAVPGFANLIHDRDGIVRRHAHALPGTAVPGFAGALAGRPSPSLAGQRWVIDWRKPADATAPAFQTTPAHILPLMAANPAILETWFAGRTVIVGADLPQQDRHVTPLSMVLGGPATAGAEIHAHLVSQILDDRFVPELSAAPRAVIAAALALLACLIALSPLSFPVRLVLLAACLATYLAGMVGLASLGAPVLPVVPAVISLVLAAGGTMGLDALLAHRDRRFVRSAFSHYLAPELVDHLIRNPSALRLGGERRRMTFLFTDIAGFTSMSERMEADALGRLLNDYLDGVGEIVMRHHGVIDKYIGDAVVALFGVPAEDPAHAARADPLRRRDRRLRRAIPGRPSRRRPRRHPHRRQHRRGGGRQFRRQDPIRLHRDRRRHEHRRPTGRFEQGFRHAHRHQRRLHRGRDGAFRRAAASLPDRRRHPEGQDRADSAVHDEWHKDNGMAGSLSRRFRRA